MKKKYPYSDDFNMLGLVNVDASKSTVTSIVNKVSSWMYRLSKPTSKVRLSHHTIHGANDFTIKIDVLTPKEKQGPLPCLFYTHGGGFMLDINATHLHYCGHYADLANCVVVMPHYRLATNAPFPASINDCYQALMWTKENATTLGIDTENMAIGGDSAGGCLAAALAQMDRDKKEIGLKFQLLIYPVLDRAMNSTSMEAFPDTPGWNAKNNKVMWDLYLKGHQEVPKYASPMSIETVAGLPPAYIEPAEFCCLREEGIAYAQRLQAAGIPTELNVTKGTIHLFDTIEKSPISKEALRRRVAALNNIFN